MAKPVKTAAALFGLGVGLVVGPALGPVAVWLGVAVAALGIGLSLIGTAESDLVEGRHWSTATSRPATDTAAGTAGVVNDSGGTPNRPTFAHLGPQVERILKLAEEQADDHLNAARLDAEKTVNAARQEAEAILRRAREQAAGNAG